MAPGHRGHVPDEAALQLLESCPDKRRRRLEWAQQAKLKRLLAALAEPGMAKPALLALCSISKEPEARALLQSAVLPGSACDKLVHSLLHLDVGAEADNAGDGASMGSRCHELLAVLIACNAACRGAAAAQLGQLSAELSGRPTNDRANSIVHVLQQAVLHVTLAHALLAGGGMQHMLRLMGNHTLDLAACIVIRNMTVSWQAEGAQQMEQDAGLPPLAQLMVQQRMGVQGPHLLAVLAQHLQAAKYPEVCDQIAQTVTNVALAGALGMADELLGGPGEQCVAISHTTAADTRSTSAVTVHRGASQLHAKTSHRHSLDPRTATLYAMPVSSHVGLLFCCWQRLQAHKRL